MDPRARAQRTVRPRIAGQLQQPLFTGLTGIARQQNCELTVDQLQNQRSLILVMLLKVVQRLFRRWPQRPQRHAVSEIQPASLLEPLHRHMCFMEGRQPAL